MLDLVLPLYLFYAVQQGNARLHSGLSSSTCLQVDCVKSGAAAWLMQPGFKAATLSGVHSFLSPCTNNIAVNVNIAPDLHVLCFCSLSPMQSFIPALSSGVPAAVCVKLGRCFYPKLSNMLLKRCQVLILNSAKLERFYFWL